MSAGYWKEQAERFAFAGTLLLVPPNQLEDPGLQHPFWDVLAADADQAVAAAASRSRQLARDDAARDVSAIAQEYVRLFMGPPRPAVAPWETMHRGGGAEGVGFGAPTYRMRDELRAAGLSFEGSGQYEDHLGIELLFLSVLCERAAEGGDATEPAAFARRHPGAWVGAFAQKVAQAAPEGLYAQVTLMAARFLEQLAEAASAAASEAADDEAPAQDGADAAGCAAFAE
ncbi:molecular chaperone TorD family protein [Eggerthellaceae bacterium zg-997]|nr:molecular chaperone TorD family protein [Eggerthellaceae bacterium zg-997]